MALVPGPSCPRRTTLSSDPSRGTAGPRELGHLSHAQRAHPVHFAFTLEDLEDLPQEVEVLVGEPTEVVRMPPDVKDPSGAGSLTHGQFYPSQPAAIEPGEPG